MDFKVCTWSVNGESSNTLQVQFISIKIHSITFVNFEDWKKLVFSFVEPIWWKTNLYLINLNLVNLLQECQYFQDKHVKITISYFYSDLHFFKFYFLWFSFHLQYFSTILNLLPNDQWYLYIFDEFIFPFLIKSIFYVFKLEDLFYWKVKFKVFVFGFH